MLRFFFRSIALSALLLASNLVSSQTIDCNTHSPNPWFAGQVYNLNEFVVANGQLYSANWSTTTSSPTDPNNYVNSLNGQPNINGGKPWTLYGTCPTPINYNTVSCASVSPWSSSTAYSNGTQVTFVTPDNTKYLYNWVYYSLNTAPNNSGNGGSNPWKLTGTCQAPGIVTVTPSTLNTFTSYVNFSSDNQTIVVSGSNLTPNSSLVITASSHFEIAKAANNVFTSSVSITVPSTGIIPNTTIYVQYDPSTAGTDNGTLTFNIGSTTLQTIQLSGTATVVPTWNLIGNSNATLNHFVGTTNNVSLILKSNNKTGIQLTDGSVALGQTGPVFIGTSGTAASNTGYYKFETKGLTAFTGPSSDNQTNILALYSGNTATVDYVAGYRHYMNFSHALFPAIGNTVPAQEYGVFNAYQYKNGTPGVGKGKHLILQNTTEGNLGVGNFTTAPSTKFAVNGTSLLSGDTKVNGELRVSNKIAALEVFVTANPLTDAFPDYVFEKDYKLMPLDTLQNYILVNKHLPEVPSAMEVKQAGQISLGEMNNLLLKKVEELTLYLIEQEKRAKLLEVRLKALEAAKK